MMKSHRPTLRLLLLSAALLVSGNASVAANASDAPELVEARARLLEMFQNGNTDNDVGVKQQRAKIAALEYVAAAKASGDNEAPSRLVSVDFPGGPAGRLVDLINKDRNTGLNVIGEKADLTIELPAFSIRNADASSLALALDELLRQRGYSLQGGRGRAGGLTPVYVLRKLAPHEVARGGFSPFQSFQLAPYLESQSVDDIVGAVRAAWELDPVNEAAALRLKFHPPTGILLVSGPPQAITTVQLVLAQLRRGPEQNPKPPTKGDKPAAAPEKR